MTGTQTHCHTRTSSFHQTMHRVGPDEDSQVDINSCTDACTHSKEGVGTNEVTGTQTHCHTGASRFPSNYT